MREVYIPKLIHDAGTAPNLFDYIVILPLTIIGDGFALIAYSRGQMIDKIFIGVDVLLNILVIFILISKIYVTIAKAVEKRLNNPHKA